jgi:putative transposase
MEEQHTKHVTYKIALHFVWCPKYRKAILVGEVAQFVEAEIRRLCQENKWTIGALNVQEDHVHLFLSTPPAVAPSLIANTLYCPASV